MPARLRQRGMGTRPLRIAGCALVVALVLAGLPACGDVPQSEGADEADATPDAAAANSDTFETGTPDPDRPFDVSIEGGGVVDGTGAPARPADLLLRDGRIVYVGPLDPDTLEIVERFDAAGRVVAPGLVDAHAHGDPASTFANFLAQGVTTILLGQDGSGPEAGSLAGHLDAVERAGTTVNVAYLAGHNTLRAEAGLGFAPGETAEAHGPLVDLVRQALEDGAFGVSLGLEYSPGRAAGPEELAAIGRVVAERDGVLMAHLRTEDRGDVVGAVDELLEVRRRTGARVHVSHIKIVLGPDPAEAGEILALMEAARGDAARGPSGGVTADLYPYLASFTGVSILFPDWARPPNDYDAVRRDRGDELAAYLRDRVQSRNGPGATLFATGPWAGRTLDEAARAEDRPFEDLLMELGPGGARAAYFVMDPAVMRRFLADPHVAVASDGSPTMGHPRGYGSFARVLGEEVDGVLELEEAVRKMTSLPASIIGLDDSTRVGTPRGRIAPGWAADIVVFDLDGVRDRADFQEPHRLAEGVDAVWVNGVRSWPAGAARPGAVLRDRGRRP